MHLRAVKHVIARPPARVLANLDWSWHDTTQQKGRHYKSLGVIAHVECAENEADPTWVYGVATPWIRAD